MVVPVGRVVLTAFLGLFVALAVASIVALSGRLSRDSLVHNPRTGDGSSSSSKIQMETCCSTLRVYMYDIPRKYNMGLLKKDDPHQDLPWTYPDVPPWSLGSGVGKQHSVEYWLMAYLLNARDCKDGEMAALRVNDPNQADVFFVPFFSTLNNYGYKMLGPDALVAKRLQVRF